MTSQYHQNTVAQFLRRLVFAQKTVARITLSHQTGRTSQNVREWDSFNEAEIWAVLKNGGLPFDEFVTEILDIASQDSDSMMGVQSYSLSAVSEEGRQLGRIALRFEGGGEDMGTNASYTGSEPPTLAGVVSQLMRHNEAQMRIIMQQSKTITDQGEKAMQLLQQQSISDIESKVELFTTMQAMLDTKSQRELDEKALAASEERKDLVLNKVIGMLPAVAARLTKGAIPVAKEDQPIHQLLQKLLSTFTAEQLEKMQTVLSPEQTMAFAELAMMMGEQDEKDTAAQKK